jgi:hypothetical protein
MHLDDQVVVAKPQPDLDCALGAQGGTVALVISRLLADATRPSAA